MQLAISTSAAMAMANRDFLLLLMLTSTSPPLKPKSPFDLNVPELVLGRLLLLRLDLLRLDLRRLRFSRCLRLAVFHRHADLMFDATAADHDGALRSVRLNGLRVAQVLERDAARCPSAGFAGLAQHQR